MKRLVTLFVFVFICLNTICAKTNIMGEIPTDMSIEKMYRFVKAQNSSFEREIAENFYNVGKKYGLRGDIALCQSVIETGWFKFTGGTAVTPDQHNYCGMGVTQIGMKGNSFATIKDGVTAQIQHLYAYACKKPIPAGEKLIDPRFSYVNRGVAPTWEDLGGRWAGAKDYGQRILNVYNKLLEYKLPLSLTASQTIAHLSGDQGSKAPYIDIEIKGDGLFSAISVNSSSKAFQIKKLNWQDLTGGTLRISLNTTLAVGEYQGYVRAVSGTQSVKIELTGTINSNEPSLSIPTTTLDFSVNSWQATSQELEIKSNNLKEDIKLTISGTDAQFFTVNPTHISKENTTAYVTVTYSPLEITTHTAMLTISSKGANPITVILNGISNHPMDGDNFIKDMNQKWIYSQNENNLNDAPWFSTVAPIAQDIAYANNKLYVLNTKAWGNRNCAIIDAYTGSKIKDLNLEGITGGENPLASIKTLGGKVIGSNGARVQDILKVYIWDNDDEAPRLWFQDGNHGSIVVGQIMSVAGNMKEGKVMFSNGSKVIVYTVINGVVNTNPSIINLTKAGKEYSVGAQKGSVDVTLNADGTYWVTGKDQYPTHFDANGEFIESFNKTSIGGGNLASGTSARFFSLGDRKYVASITYLAQSASLAEGALSVYDMTDGINVEGITPQIYPANGLGSSRNTSFQSAVCCEVNELGVNLWIMIPSQGIAYYNYKGMRPSGIDNTTHKKETIKLLAKEGTIDVLGTTVMSIDIYNISGLHIKSALNTNQINIEDLQNGIYIIAVKDEVGKIHNKKVVIR